MTLAVAVFLLLLAPQEPAADVGPARAAQGGRIVIGGVPYEKLETREATLARMLELLQPEKAKFGTWYLIEPFLYAGHGTGDLATPRGPEAELPLMQAGGPGPDLDRVWTGKDGVECRWKPLGDIAGRAVNLLLPDAPPSLNENVCAYLYVAVESDEARTVTLPLGTDDGVRVWLNGRLVLDRDVARGLTPDDDTLRLDLARGRNHLLFKVSQGVGAWAFQISTRAPLSSDVDSHLYYQLDRDFPPSPERRHYELLTVPIPDGLVVEVGGLAFLPDGKPVCTTRRGDVFLVENAYETPPVHARFTLFADGLHEPLGCAVREDEDGVAVYVVQRPELTRLLDLDGDDRADLYETFCDAWGVSGNYHEFAFGPKFDEEGNAWVTLNVGFCGSLGKALVWGRGACLRIDRAGRATWICDGLRSPNGIGFFAGRALYVDNQGDYVATNKLSVLEPGSWHGHPASLRWREDLAPGERPPRKAPAVWFPYERMGRSAADIALCDEEGRFGPFDGQLFVGDQFAASVMRVTLEEVDGELQGACYPFFSGMSCGVNRIAFAPDGSLFVGETDRGWASVGRRRFGLERIRYTGEPPFELLEMKARPDGFELVFTADLDPESAADPASYALRSHTYEYHADYGAPEIDGLDLEVTEARVVGPRTVRLFASPLREGYVHTLTYAGVRSSGGRAPLHTTADYTLNRVPGRAPREEGELPTVLCLDLPGDGSREDLVRPRPHIFSRLETRLQEALADLARPRALYGDAALAVSAEDLAAAHLVLLAAPSPEAVSDALRARLLDYAEGGGTLVLLPGIESAFGSSENVEAASMPRPSPDPFSTEPTIEAAGAGRVVLFGVGKAASELADPRARPRLRRLLH